MTIYQKELLRRLAQYGCVGEIEEGTGMLHMSIDGYPLCIAGKKADLYWNQDNLATQQNRKTINALCEAVITIREYVSLYESAPPLGVDSLPEYRRLAEYNDTVLGAMYSEQHGFMFCTWQQDKEKKHMTWGDYTSDYEYAKTSFVTRSRLADKNRMFTVEEAENLYRCIDYVRGNCEKLTCEQEQQLKSLAEKLTYGYPQLDDEPPSFNDDSTIGGDWSMKKQNTQQKRKRGRSVQELIGIKTFTKYGLAVGRGELLFYQVSPTNISVLSHTNIEIKIRHLMTVLSAIPDIEITCTDSSECFDGNKSYLHTRLAEEPNPKVRKIIKKDIEFLDHIQVEMATARQFLFIARLKERKDK